MSASAWARWRRRGAELTLVRHGLAAALAIVALLLLASVVDQFRDTQIAKIAYLLPAAAGLTVLTGLNGQISLGQGAFMAIGGYTAALLEIHWHLPVAILLLVSLLAGALGGAFVGVGAARLRGPYLAGATLALAVGLPSVANWSKVSGTLGGQNGLQTPSPIAPAVLGNAFPPGRWQAWISCVAAVLIMFLLANLASSGVGRKWRAVRDDEVASALCGLRVSRVQLRAFVVSSASAGLGGGLLTVAVDNLATPSAFNLPLSLSLLSAVVIGGLGSLSGAVYGCIILVYLPTWANALTPSGTSTTIQANLPLAIYGVALIAVMLAFPRGIHGALSALVRVGRNRLPAR